jgi:hypothetical protein
MHALKLSPTSTQIFLIVLFRLGSTLENGSAKQVATEWKANQHNGYRAQHTGRRIAFDQLKE